MNLQFESLLRDFDKKYKLKRIRPKVNIELPVELLLNQLLPLSAPKVYAALKYLQVGSMPIRISYRELTIITALSEKTVVKALKKLKENSFLNIEFCSGDTNIYQFSHKPKKDKKAIAVDKDK